ncbi:adenosine kinase [Tenuifilum sp.]|uniref:adenosine kinase n=1 Tax=Tenuifilum sp. TaxID=2760880 RepID=UPI002CC642DC|nr:adenosine kinase [Tenuifilum sp.]HQG71932.1 adenosine kinase [Tenuifilum sp.]HRS44074.1 adenosine kinase [Tenuifilum sp.]HRU85995.1 adenosine kinase [Tenuifilum sp.]
MAKFLGLGNALVDILVQLPNDAKLFELNLPKGSMQLVDAERMQSILAQTEGLPRTLAAGGSAANTIHGLANLGMSTAFIGKVGDDSFGQAFANDMIQNGITPIMLKGNAESGRALAFITPDSERTFAVYLGAAIEMTPNDLDPSLFNGYTHFHIEGYLVQNHGLVRKAVELAKQSGCSISLDLASYNVVDENRDFLREVVKNYVDIVFANEEEAKAFTGKTPVEALHELGKLADIAVVKLGADGSLIKQGETTFEVGVIEVSSIDTTGAGDLYAAGFLYGLSKGLSLLKCGEIGAILSGHVIEVLGPKMDGIRWSKVKDLVLEVEKN